MAMRRLGLGLLAAGLIALAGSGTVRADNDTLRLGTSSTGAAGAVFGDADTALVYWRGGGHWGGGHWGGGHWGGYRSHWGGYAAYRPFHRPYWGGYGYRPVFYRPAYYGGYYGGYYGAGYGGYYGAGYYPCGGQSVTPIIVAPQPPPALQYAAPPLKLPYQQQAYAPQVLPAPAGVPQQPPGFDPTFPYDGGPNAPMPMPGTDNADPASGPRPTIPLQGKLVHLQKETTGGSTQMTTQFISVGTAPTTTSQPAASPAPTRYTYPAYGEQPLPPVTRKQSK
jgi:hypothetical protein